MDRIYEITAIGRPLDPRWRTNRAVLYLLPLLALAGGTMAWLDGASAANIVITGVRTALLGFAAWAVARELAPDDQAAAFIAMGIALTTLINVPEPGFLLLFLALVLTRVLNRSTGVDLKKTDAIAVLGLGAFTAWDHGSPAPLVVTALTFAWASRLSDSARWQRWAAGIALVGAVLVGAVFGPGIGSGEALSRHGMLVPAIFGVAFLITILATRRVVSVGDRDDLPLSAQRVRAAMWIALLLATANLVHGSPLAANGVALWSVLGGVALGKLINPASWRRRAQ